MAITRVQTAVAGGRLGNSTNRGVTWSSSTTTGNLLVAIVGWNNDPGTITAPSGWSQIGSTVINGSSYASIWYSGNASSQSGSSWSWTNSVLACVVASEYAGADTSPLDVNGTNSGSSSSPSTGSISPTSTDYLAVGGLCLGLASTTNVTYSSPTDSYTISASNFNVLRSTPTDLQLGIALLDKIGSLGSTTSTSATSSNSGAWAGLIASFKSAGGGGSTVSITHTSDTLLKGSASRTHTSDTLLKGSASRTHTSDALLKGSASRTHTSDALLKGVTSKNHTVDFLLRIANTEASHTTDTFLKAGDKKESHTTDTSLTKSNSITHSTDFHLTKEVETVTGTSIIELLSLTSFGKVEIITPEEPDRNLNVRISNRRLLISSGWGSIPTPEDNVNDTPDVQSIEPGIQPQVNYELPLLIDKVEITEPPAILEDNHRNNITIIRDSKEPSSLEYNIIEIANTTEIARNNTTINEPLLIDKTDNVEKVDIDLPVIKKPFTIPIRKRKRKH